MSGEKREEEESEFDFEKFKEQVAVLDLISGKIREEEEIEIKNRGSGEKESYELVYTTPAQMTEEEVQKMYDLLVEAFPRGYANIDLFHEEFLKSRGTIVTLIKKDGKVVACSQISLWPLFFTAKPHDAKLAVFDAKNQATDTNFRNQGVGTELIRRSAEAYELLRKGIINQIKEAIEANELKKIEALLLNHRDNSKLGAKMYDVHKVELSLENLLNGIKEHSSVVLEAVSEAGQVERITKQAEGAGFSVNAEGSESMLEGDLFQIALPEDKENDDPETPFKIYLTHKLYTEKDERLSGKPSKSSQQVIIEFPHITDPDTKKKIMELTESRVSQFKNWREYLEFLNTMFSQFPEIGYSKENMKKDFSNISSAFREGAEIIKYPIAFRLVLQEKKAQLQPEK